jgi:hypothetical protein
MNMRRRGVMFIHDIYYETLETKFTFIFFVTYEWAQKARVFSFVSLSGPV